MTKDEALKLALDALEHAEAGLADIGDADREPGDDLAWCERRAAQALPKTRATITAIREALAQPEQEQGDNACQEGDGCPTEKAVLQRFWRGQPIPAEHYPTWFKAQSEQEPVATLWQHGETGRTRITMPDDITDCDARWFKAADLYTTPLHRKPLTDEMVKRMKENCTSMEMRGAFADGWLSAEAAHGIKETS